jgi:CYTH domain-containing protein
VDNIKELERKFIVNRVPEYMLDYHVGSYLIEQNYLYSDIVSECRIRREVNLMNEEVKNSIDLKSGVGKVRDEESNEISYEMAEKFLVNDYYPIVKQRDIYFLDGNFIEVDFYDDLELIVAEIEFINEAEMNKFEMYGWMIKEVSNQEEYKNKNLWKKLNKRSVEEWE